MARDHTCDGRCVQAQEQSTAPGGLLDSGDVVMVLLRCSATDPPRRSAVRPVG